MYRVTVVLFATIISTSFAQEVFDGSCPKVRVVQPFIAARFAGSWYEWGRYSSQTELETKCNVFEFVFHDDAKNLEVYYSGLTDDDSEISMKGSAILTKPAGQFNLTIPEIGINNLSYFILGTDYRNWVAFFACRDLDGNQHQRYVWFMTRSVCPTAADILSARNAIIGQGISVESLEPVDQQHLCGTELKKLYKVAVVIFAIVGTSLAQVVVDGSCPKVKVVQDFSAAKFAGSWYEAERFSSETETGAKCNVANYFFNGDGTANITYSSVGAKGQAFNLVGSAVYREPVGQLNISIPQLGSGTFDYLILDSDYDNWTSFFVCRERGNNQHQRYVWLVTRQQVAAEAHLVAARKAVTDQGISLDPLEVVNQKNC